MKSPVTGDRFDLPEPCADCAASQQKINAFSAGQLLIEASQLFKRTTSEKIRSRKQASIRSFTRLEHGCLRFRQFW